jgi:tetratricopeptide (TPR) repeat protein
MPSMSVAQEPVGSLEVALAHATKLLASDAALAVQQAHEILKVVPNHPPATLILAQAKRAVADIPGALAVLESLVQSQPNWALAHFELGRTRSAAGQGDAATESLRRAVGLKPDLADAWRVLGDHLTIVGDTHAADAAYANHIRASTRDPRLLEPAAALCEGRIAVAEALLRKHLIKHPTDVAAIRMLAEVAARLGRLEDAEHLLARCLELVPGFAAARQNYAVVLNRQSKHVQALAQVDQLLAADPRNPTCRNLKAAILGAIGEYERSIEIYDGVLAEYPNHAKIWMSYGHALKTAGRVRDGVQAYRRSLQLAPNLGESYWSLANLKTYRFGAEEIATMRAQLARADLSDEDRLHFHFALGKALEDAGEYAASFEHYADGNRIRRYRMPYDADKTSAIVQRSMSLFSVEFFHERRGWGAGAADPIFVVGLPRSGSTLIEQILASHSSVEGTMELHDIVAMARSLGRRSTRDEPPKFPDVLASLDAQAVRALGEQYIERTRIQRKTAAPRFIDKLPNNWLRTGMIHLILPSAKIIDARRHPLSCCFSNFKQQFARGQNFSYDLVDLGRYYRDYVALMAHFDQVLPGRVHRVHYEAMVEDTESEIRRLLEYCGLPFEDACLRFYETERAVRTPSSEQVRSPIFREGLDQWRHYEAWLGPLKEALGPVLLAYPEVKKI